MPARSPLFDVPAEDAKTILQEIALRAETKRRATTKAVDPELGTTHEEAEASLQRMRDDINEYGKYVYSLEPARHHRLWNQVVDDVIQRRIRQNKVLFIAPPGTAKSTWNSIIRATHYLGNHPDHHLLFMTSSDDMAKDFNGAVKSVFETNERHQAIFNRPENKPNRRRWSNDGLFFHATPPGVKDPAYKAVGFGSTVMGARAHGIILDDVLDQKNAQSAVEQAKAISYYNLTVTKRLMPDIGWMIAVMTRFHEQDLASHFIRLAEESGDWVVVHLPMVAFSDRPDPLGRAPGELLWPARFNEKWLEEEQASMTLAEFNLVHQGDPTGMGGDLFKSEEEWHDLPANYWTELYDRHFVLQAWDLGFSEKDQTCFSAGGSFSVDRRYNAYLHHVSRKRLSIPKLEDEIVAMAKAGNPWVVVIETENFHDHVIQGIVQRILERVYINIVLIKVKQDKITRARIAVGMVEHGKMYVWKKAPWYRDFMTELLGFPNRKYKDQVDMLSLMAQAVSEMSLNQANNQVIEAEVAMSA